MCDEWMPVLEWELTLEQYHQLPRNPAYKYEYIGGRALLSPRPRHYHARLDLSDLPEAPEPVGPAAGVDLRSVDAADWPRQLRPELSSSYYSAGVAVGSPRRSSPESFLASH